MSSPVFSPQELHRRVPQFGIQMQRHHRQAGDFPIPHTSVGNRIYYRRSSVDRFLAEQETEPKPDTHPLDAALRAILDTAGLSDRVRTQIAELIGAGGKGPEEQPAGAPLDPTLLGVLAIDDESRERLVELIGGAADETP